MKLHQRIGRSVARRSRKLQNCLPSLEMAEPRVLMATGFVQGFALTSSHAPIQGETIQLENVSTSQSITTTTNALGYYAFNSVPTGTYDVTETAGGYTATGVNIQTTVNAATALGTTGIQVTVENVASESIGGLELSE